MCCSSKSSPPPTVDPRQYEALAQQNAISQQMVSHTIEQDALNNARLRELDTQNKAITDDFLANSKKANARADEQYDYYMERGRPMVDRMFDDANNWDDDGALAGVRGRSYADAEQQFGVAQQAGLRNLSRMGVNPGSGRYMSALAGSSADAALAKVNAANQLVEGRRAQGVQLRQQAANVANGFQATSMNLSGLGNSSGSGAAGIGQMGLQGALGVQGAYNQGMGGAGSMAGNVASGYGGIYNGQLNAWNSQNQSNAQASAGIGSALGTAATTAAMFF